jgi:hypothetical protein
MRTFMFRCVSWIAGLGRSLGFAPHGVILNNYTWGSSAHSFGMAIFKPIFQEGGAFLELWN